MGHPKQPFPFLSGSWIRATLPEYMAPQTTDGAGSCQHVYSPLNGTEVRRVGEVHLPVQSGTELTNYHILGMWLVLSNA